MAKQIILFYLLFLLASCKKKGTPAFICDADKNIPEADSASLRMPNAFTPNDDGLNDRIFPLFKNMAELEFTVYDENSNVLYNSNLLTGNLYDPGSTDKNLTIYYYKIKAITTSGNPVLKCGKIYGLTCLPPNTKIQDFLFGDQYNPSIPDGQFQVTAEQLTSCK